MFEKLEKVGRKYIPLSLTSVGKRFIARPRYNAQLKVGKKGYLLHGEKYPQETLFVGGLPKSGTTWLEKMLCTLDGFTDIMIPEAVYYGEKHNESHTFDFPKNTFTQLKKALTVLKLHCHGSQSNFDILKANEIQFVVIYRDLRDVAVSYIFYIKRTTYHPEHRKYKTLSTKDALLTFSREVLPSYVKWIDSWHQYENEPSCCIIRYEDLKEDTFNQMKTIFNHYGISLSDDKIKDIIEVNSFKKLSGGRKQGEQSKSSFFRKGISGDWKNHFDEDVISAFKKEMGNYIEKYGYEPF